MYVYIESEKGLYTVGFSGLTGDSVLKATMRKEKTPPPVFTILTAGIVSAVFGECPSMAKKYCPYSMVHHVCGLEPAFDVCRKCLKEMAGIKDKGVKVK